MDPIEFPFAVQAKMTSPIDNVHDDEDLVVFSDEELDENMPEFLDDEDSFLPQVTKCLLEIFDRFDVDKDGTLNDKEIGAYFAATNDMDFSDDEEEEMEQEVLQEIKDNFETDDNGNLTKRGFLEMYQLQTLSEPQETWRDLQKHGYNEHFVKQEQSVLNKVDDALMKSALCDKEE